jgi:hypothetical protein
MLISRLQMMEGEIAAECEREQMSDECKSRRLRFWYLRRDAGRFCYGEKVFPLACCTTTVKTRVDIEVRISANKETSLKVFKKKKKKEQKEKTHE